LFRARHAIVAVAGLVSLSAPALADGVIDVAPDAFYTDPLISIDQQIEEARPPAPDPAPVPTRKVTAAASEAKPAPAKEPEVKAVPTALGYFPDSHTDLEYFPRRSDLSYFPER
jgi:hypothetical protein